MGSPETDSRAGSRLLLAEPTLQDSPQVMQMPPAFWGDTGESKAVLGHSKRNSEPGGLTRHEHGIWSLVPWITTKKEIVQKPKVTLRCLSCDQFLWAANPSQRTPSFPSDVNLWCFH